MSLAVVDGKPTGAILIAFAASPSLDGNLVIGRVCIVDGGTQGVSHNINLKEPSNANNNI